MPGEILTSLHGREIGLDADGNLILNKLNGRRVVIEDGFSEAEAAAVRASVPALSWAAASPPDAPIAGPLSAAPALLSPLTPIVIPAGSLAVGDRIEFFVHFARTGTAASVAPRIYAGKVSAFSGDVNGFPVQSISTSQLFNIIKGQMIVTSATSLMWELSVNRVTGALTVDSGTITTHFDIAEDFHITFGFPAITAPDTVSLRSYQVRVHAPNAFP